jgi:hypothetical protein
MTATDRGWKKLSNTLMDLLLEAPPDVTLSTAGDQPPAAPAHCHAPGAVE